MRPVPRLRVAVRRRERSEVDAPASRIYIKVCRRAPWARCGMWGRLPTFFCSRRTLRRYVKQELENVVRSELDAVGFDLVEIRAGGTRNRPQLEVRIDRRDGAAVTVDDCATASRALEARLDGGALIAEQYVLQVSSPGVERPLRSPADWRRFVGRWASVNSPLLHGRAEVQIVALEGEREAEVAVLRLADGAERRIPLAEVSDARLAFRWPSGSND